jgi:hypothetical protein
MMTVYYKQTFFVTYEEKKFRTKLERFPWQAFQAWSNKHSSLL